MDYQVSEAQLPERLQREFAQLSEGLLSNVALATIASIRHVAHHVVGKFNGRMDGPYFHHRATIPAPDDAESYAVEIVLSELKNAVDKQRVADQYAGRKAIEARIQNIAGDRNQLRLSYENSGKVAHCDLDIGDVVKLIVDGCNTAHKDINVSPKPGKDKVKDSISSLFGDSQDDPKENMKEFASLTGVRAHPGNYLWTLEGNYPALGLGSVVQDHAKQYWICLQASCDSVRLKKATAFLFVPLCEDNSKPELVVPALNSDGVVAFLGLRLEKTAYNQATSVLFTPDNEVQTVKATKIKGREGFYFKAIKRKNYLWVADVKHRRALRIAQRLGQDMGRLGFDEFEPFRQQPGDVD